MNRVIFAAASAAALLVAGAASAQSATSTLTINGTANAKCGVNATTATVSLPNDLTNDRALVREAVSQEIASALNTANIRPFCNGVGNSVQVVRSVLAHSDASGGGLTGGFAQYVNYNLDASINGLELDSTTTANASTVGRFGGHNSDIAATRINFAANGVARAATSNTNDVTSTNWSNTTDRRLVAGAYTGSVSVIIAPAA